MNDMDKIKILMFRVCSDGDFYWNINSFPREKDECGDLQNTVLVFLKNPTMEDIKDFVRKIAKEFKESFSACKGREWLYEERDDIYNTLLKSINVDENLRLNEFDYNCEINGFCDICWSNGNYDMDLKLIDYIEKEIAFANCAENTRLQMIDINFNNLL